jgi:Trypsin-co-occurring domain 1
VDQSRVVAVDLSNGRKLNIEVTDLAGSAPTDTEQAVAALPNIRFSDIVPTIEGLAAEMSGLLQRIGPTKAGVEFAVEIGLESGQLTALLVKGSGKANFKIMLNWENIGPTPHSMRTEQVG